MHPSMFMSDSFGRCAEYRGSTVEFNTCLNLTDKQVTTSTTPRPPQAEQQNSPFKPKIGPQPHVQPAAGQAGASGFRPAANGR
jgi:5'-3' exoribonuclease 1